MSSGFAVRRGVSCGVAGFVLAAAVFAAQPESRGPATSQPKKPAAGKSGKATAPKGGAAKPTDKSALPTPDAKSLKRWKDLDGRRRKLRRRLKDLRSEFIVSSRVRKLEIKKEFERLLDEWKTGIEPEMVKLSLAKLAADPDSELASRLAEDDRNPAQAVAVAEQLIKAGKGTGPVLRLAGLAHFTLNNFQRSLELLEQARDKNARLSVSDTRTIDLARDYVKHWQKERELQKKEAAAAGVPEKRLPQALIETGKGNMVVELFENEAPNTVANFISLADKKFFDGQHFYNSQPLRSIDAGDPTTKPDFKKNLGYGFSGPGYTIKNESTEDNARMHFRGSLSMVSEGLDSEGSLFSILRAPRPEWNPTAGGLGGRAVFGRVVKGMHVVDTLQNGDKIVKVTVVRKRPHEYQPKTSADKDEPAKKDTSKKPGAKSKDASKEKAPAFPKIPPKAKGDGAAKTKKL